MRVGVIDYGVGNLGSIKRSLEELQIDAVLLGDPSAIKGVDRLILPGVGNFTECMERLAKGGWIEPLRDAVHARQAYLLGVCVGMQMLADFGSEGAATSSNSGTAGLGFVPGRVDHLSSLGCSLRIPHVGWNSVETTGSLPELFNTIPEGTDFYFVHSYAFQAAHADNIVGTTGYSIPITAVVRKGRVMGTQFHPEKSSRAGFALLRNFVTLHTC